MGLGVGDGVGEGVGLGVGDNRAWAGVARFAKVPARALGVRATKLDLTPASARLARKQ